MVVMMVAPSARLAWCAGLGGLSVAERLTFRPRRTTRRIGLALVLGASFAVLAVALGL